MVNGLANSGSDFPFVAVIVALVSTKTLTARTGLTLRSIVHRAMKHEHRLLLRRGSVYYAFDNEEKRFPKSQDQGQSRDHAPARRHGRREPPACDESQARAHLYLRHSDPMVPPKPIYSPLLWHQHDTIEASWSIQDVAEELNGAGGELICSKRAPGRFIQVVLVFKPVNMPG